MCTKQIHLVISTSMGENRTPFVDSKSDQSVKNDVRNDETKDVNETNNV